MTTSRSEHAADGSVYIAAPSPRIYIAGPMRGRPDHNFPAFRAAEARFTAAGWGVINPVTVGEALFRNDPDEPGGHYLRADVAALVQCEAIALLPEWDHSTGARCEAAVAVTIGLPFYDAISGEPIPTPERIVCAGGYDRPAGPVRCTCGDEPGLRCSDSPTRLTPSDVGVYMADVMAGLERLGAVLRALRDSASARVDSAPSNAVAKCEPPAREGAADAEVVCTCGDDPRAACSSCPPDRRVAPRMEGEGNALN